MKKSCEYLSEHTMKIINFKKKKNEIINKRATGIIPKCKSLLYYVYYELLVIEWNNSWKY